MITVEALNKTYPVAVKEPGLKGTIEHFFRRTYRSIQAVQDVSFAIEPGEVVGFLGPNGAGKTTTLKMLTGLIHPTSGQVNVAGHIFVVFADLVCNSLFDSLDISVLQLICETVLLC